MNIFYHPNRPGLMQENEMVQRIDSLNAAAKDMIHLALKEGLDLSRRAYHQATSNEFWRNPYIKGVADALLNMGYFHLEAGDSTLALAQAKEALHIYNEINDPFSQAAGQRLLGMVYTQQNEFNKAMSALMKALDIARHLPDQRLLGEITLSIGHAYLSSNEFEPAISELKKAMAIFQRYDIPVPLSFTYIFLANAYKMQGDYETFQQYLLRASELAEDMRVHPVTIEVLQQKGQNELRQGNLYAATEFFEQASQLASQQGYQIAKISSQLWLSEIDHYRNDLDAAYQKLQNALTDAQNHHYEEGCLRANRKLALISAEKGEYKQAYDYFQDFYQAEQRIKRERTDLKHVTLETLIRTEALQKEAQILQTKNDQIEKEIVERKWVEEALRQSEDKYRRALNLDPTTSVNTLRYFYDLADQEIQRVNRYPHPLSLIILDIHQFHAVNERFGYIAGDQVLLWVARRLKDLLRSVDVIGRYGGDAFILLLPETNLENAQKVSQRIQHHFTKSQLEVADEKLNLSFHMGVVEYEKGLPVDLYIQRGDQALQRSKQQPES